MHESPHWVAGGSNHWEHRFLHIYILVEGQLVWGVGLAWLFLGHIFVEVTHMIELLLNYIIKTQHRAMFDELLEEMNQTIKGAMETAHSLDCEVRESRISFGVNQQSANFHDPTHSLGKAMTFPKSQRWKALEKQQAKTTDSFHEVSENIQHLSNKGIKFSKSDRFQMEKEDEMTIINPNYDVVKKNNTQAPIIRLAAKDLGKSQISQITAASETEVGPGKYFLNQTQVKNQKIVSFSKSKRFAKEKKQYQDTPLFPQDTLTKKRPPTAAVLKPKISKNKKQISIERQDELRERLKLVFWKSIPLELDRLLKKHPGGPILKKQYFDIKNMRGRQRNCALMHLLNRLNEERGGFQSNLQKKLGDGPCGVIYRKSAPKPFKFNEMQPGPDYYYPQDDLIKASPVGFTFAKQKQKQAEPDSRDYKINDEFMKKGGNIVIHPEHQPHRLTQEQIRELNRGPGFYDCLFSQVEKRNDIGVVKFQQINDKNARQNNCVDIKEVNDGVYFPSYEGIDANVAAPVYREPSNVRPAHMPDKQIFPQHWMFYDGDLNKVRAEIAKNVLMAQGMDFAQYSLYAKKFQAFKNLMEDRRKIPDSLSYEVNYQALDPHLEGFDMKNKPQKTLIDPIVKEEGSVDGDNLLLDPTKPGKKLPQISFKKMVGRQEEQLGVDQVKQGDRLILNPQKPEKHIGEVDFKKMVDRPEICAQKNLDQQPAEGDRILINPHAPDKKIPTIDFKKQSNRPDIVKVAQDDDQFVSENIINPDTTKKVKGFVELKRMTEGRFVIRAKKKIGEKASTIKNSVQKRKRTVYNSEDQEQRSQGQ